MNEIPVARGLMVSALITMLVGVVVFRLLPGWDGLEKELGSADAWKASAFYHLFYTLFIMGGTLLFLLELKLLKGRPKRYTVAIAAAASITTLHFALNVYGLKVSSGVVLGLGLVACSWAFNMAIFYLMKLFDRTTEPTP